LHNYKTPTTPTTQETRKKRILGFMNSFKVVHVRYRDGLYKFIKIEDMEDMFRYIEAFTSKSSGALWRVIRTENMDDYRIENCVGKSITLEHYIAQLHLYGCKGVIEAFADLNSKRFDSMYKIYRSHGALIVNEAGGFQPLKDRVVEYEEYEPDFYRVFS
jgi:hypothetical protein